MKHKFIFGNAPELAEAELKAVNPSDIDDPQKLIKILGGTVKIAEILPENIKLTDIIKGDFGISDLTGRLDIFKLCKDIKAETGQRFVLPQKGERQLSSVVVAKQKLTEIIIGENFMAKTVAVQDFEDWGKRDYGRPAAAGHIGMLPPKVARMMINISRGQTILDPFCGTGTILMEALILNLKAVGSDIDPNQIERTKKNLDWLGKNAELFIWDARKISEKLTQKVDAIVTEPDLGPRNDLEQLYFDCLTDWRKVLKPNGQVVIALPFVKNIIDKAKTIGYTLAEGPYLYARPQAKIKRNICVFIYGTH